MLFNSWEFLALLIIALPLYYLPVGVAGRKVWQVTVLLAASAIFYAWEQPSLLCLLAASCLVNALSVERILTLRAAGQVRPARCWMQGAVISNLAFLGFFKYAGFAVGMLPDGWLDDEAVAQARAIPLPVGISFYTFQGISLVVDVWRRDISETTAGRLAARGRKRLASLRDASFYISFFPQLVAGPIVKAHEFVDQIGAKRFVDIDWKVVRSCLIAGYFLKMFVADNLAEQTSTLTLGADRLQGDGPINLLSLLYGYSLQIFADFAGYSLIAIGLGALFGYRLPENFRFPYLATSITEFWRRWHLSLSAWLRDYLYVPLGGNRRGAGRTYFNLFLVMFLGGLWHGAAWKFALWGTCHGVFLAAERFLFRRRGKLAVVQKPKTSESNGRPWSLVGKLAGWTITFQIVTFLWLTFMMPDLASIVAFFEGVASGRTPFSGPPAFALCFYGSAVVIYHAWGWLCEHRESWALRLRQPLPEGIVHGLMLFLILTNPGAPQGFIYFQF